MQKMHASGEKISMLTCYDASFAALLDECMVDVLLVGDSLGMVIQGHASTLPVSMADMCYHVTAVARGCQRSLLIADMPFGSSQISAPDTFGNAVKLMQAGAQMVKIEGGAEMSETVSFLCSRGIPVCAHIGLQPQSVHLLGGYKIQGASAGNADRIASDALALQNAGATMILMEAVPAEVAARISNQLVIPTIGIGAGGATSGQVLVLYDMLDITLGKKPRFVKNYMHGAISIAEAVKSYVADVKSGMFPADEHGYGSHF